MDLDVLSDILSLKRGLSAAAALVVLTFLVVMVAVCACVDQFSPQVCLDRFVRITGSSCADLDPRIVKRVKRAAAKTAADQHLNVVLCQKSCQCAVPDPV